MKSSFLNALYSFALMGLAFLFYGRFMGLFFIADDFSWLENAHWSVEHLNNIFTLDISHYFRPVAHLFIAVEYLIFKLNPIGYHVVSILLHSLNAILFFYFLRDVLKVENPFLLRLAPLLWVTHFVYFGAVGWISAFPNLLLVAFIFLSFLAWTKKRPNLFCTLFILALLTKEESVFLLPLWVFYLYRFEKRGLSLFRSKSVLVAVFFWFAYVLLEVYLQSTSPLVQSATVSFSSQGFLQFFEKFFILFFDLQPTVSMLVSTWGLLLFYGFFLWRFLSEPLKKPTEFMLLFLIFSLLPTSFFSYGNTSHYFYLPSLAAVFLIVALMAKVFESLSWKRWAIGAGVLFLAISHFLTLGTAKLVIEEKANASKTFLNTLSNQSENFGDKTFNFIEAPFELAHIYSMMNLYFDVPRERILTNAPRSEDYINLDWSDGA